MLRRIEIHLYCGWIGPNMLVPWEGLKGLSGAKRQRHLRGAQFWFTELGWQSYGRELLQRCLRRFPAADVRVRARRETGCRRETMLRGDPHQVAIKKGR